MGAHVRRTTLYCQKYKKQDDKLDSHAAKKGCKEMIKLQFRENNRILK